MEKGNKIEKGHKSPNRKGKKCPPIPTFACVAWKKQNIKI